MNRLYSIDEFVVPCENGFHFCETIEELNGYNNINSNRIFEIEAYGEIIKSGEKYVAEKIKFVRKLTKEEINNYFKQNQKSL